MNRVLMMEFNSQNCPFNSDHSPFGDVVLSSRARLARNLEGFPFVNRSTHSDCLEVTSLLRPLSEHKSRSTALEWIDMNSLDEVTTNMLVERHLISSTLAQSEHPRAIAVGPELSRSVMINEEDHIRIQSIRPGLQLEIVHEDVQQLDLRVEAFITYAFDEQLGFLTACPTNIGTGARFSVMLHLPGLRILKDLQRVHHACEAMSIAIRGFRGEGSGTVADLFQVSNQITMGKTEEQLCELLSSEFIPPVVEWERAARNRILDEQSNKLDDQTYRSLGILQNARLLDPAEAMKNLGNIRLGVCLNRIHDISLHTINSLMISIHPAHIKYKYGKSLTSRELDKIRADLIRESLKS